MARASGRGSESERSLGGRVRVKDFEDEIRPYVIYTFGCAGRHIDELAGEVKRLRATIVDIRLVPGADQQWGRQNLQRTFGPRYVWIRELGRMGGKDAGLVNTERGARRLGAISADGTAVVLLCDCKKLETCHRLEIADRLHSECGWAVQHLASPRRGVQPEIGQLFSGG